MWRAAMNNIDLMNKGLSDTLVEVINKKKIKAFTKTMAAHLVSKYYIDGYGNNLVFTFTNNAHANNLRAIENWIESHVNEFNVNDKDYWEQKIERVLNDIS